MRCFYQLITIQLLIISFEIYAASSTLIAITDRVPFHIHPEGEFFTVKINATTEDPGLPIYYQWRDFSGKPITEPKPLTMNHEISVQSPSTLPGYYGLVIKPFNDEVSLNDRFPGEELEFGFGIVTSDQDFSRDEGELSQFGTVHTNLNDHYMPAWIKTLTWKTASSQEWKKEIDYLNKAHFHELPIIVDDEWESDDVYPVTSDQLKKLESKVSRYFVADKRVGYWELGIEENLQSRYRQKYYWQNLTAKSAVVRQAADQINPQLKLVYQIAELDLKSVRLFLNSKAAENFDVLSLHPYKWPDFPDAESWLPEYLGNVRKEMTIAGKHLPVWFTEVGAPHHGNHPDHFFGYPQGDTKVQGLTRARSGSFMTKLHVVAFQQGVEKVFWYNYIDRESDREYAENHFGMVDYRGYPKPVYLAYLHLYSLLKTKRSVGMKILEEDVLIYTFENQHEQTLVIWNRSIRKNKVSVDELGIDAEQVTITNAVGKPESVLDGFINISEVPLFINSQK